MHSVSSVAVAKLLGVHLRHDLNFSQVKSVVATCNQKPYLLAQLKNKLLVYLHLTLYSKLSFLIKLCMLDAKNHESWHHRATLWGCIFAAKACIDSRKKDLLNSNISPTGSHDMSTFGPLTAKICSGVWGTPAHFKPFNGFRVLAGLLHGAVVMGVSQTLRH